ncbi:MAG TPA: hypothetical protein VKA94_01795, partial [Hyphomicrobiales bacterium]|nr:hypothetical protein [Hyphomicrobiales bacterium]
APIIVHVCHNSGGIIRVLLIGNDLPRTAAGQSRHDTEQHTMDCLYRLAPIPQVIDKLRQVL